VFWCRGSIAAIHDVSGSFARLSLRLDHAPQQADEMCHIGVCCVFKGIVVNGRGAARGLGSDQMLEIASRQCGSDSARMSETGHSRQFDDAPITSGLPLWKDIVRKGRLGRFVPISDIAKQKSVVRKTLGKLGFCSFHRFGHGRIRSVAVRLAIEIGALQVMLQSSLFVRL
jgi:hypothetical protein